MKNIPFPHRTLVPLVIFTLFALKILLIPSENYVGVTALAISAALTGVALWLREGHLRKIKLDEYRKNKEELVAVLNETALNFKKVIDDRDAAYLQQLEELKIRVNKNEYNSITKKPMETFKF